jgi:rRNA maturation protein Nop10
VSDTINCGFCGDPHAYDVEHKCWAYDRIQTQETLHETCQICGELILSPHWRCYPDPVDVQS